MSKPIVIVFGNVKGGTGKSTLSVHVFARLINLGFKVAAIDCDVNQGSISRYLHNRDVCIKNGIDILTGPYTLLSRFSTIDYDLSSLSNLKKHVGDMTDNCQEFVDVLTSYKNNHFIVVDTPGSIDPLFVTAHSYADIVVTPVNDSFVDLDLIGDMSDGKNFRLGVYSEILWEAKKIKAQRGDSSSIEWIVVKNRISGAQSANAQKISEILNSLSQKLGFIISPGLCERVIFRELFREGKTVFDGDINDNLSYIVARSEIDSIVQVIFELLKKRKNI